MRDVVEFAVATAEKREPGNIILEMGGPEALSQLDAVCIFEKALGKKSTLEHVPLEALEQQHHSEDPLQKAFAALMIACAKGDAIPEAQANAARYGIRLHSVAEYAAQFR
jgi:uncharacterized protein YbjT (DUF2867 family)